MFPFAKFQAVGNDFVVADADRFGPDTDLASVALAVCARQRGVGADGLLLLGSQSGASLSMRIFNADGSEDTMCGNGLRCVVRWAVDRGLAPAAGVAHTRAGCIPYRIDENGKVTLNLGAPRFDPEGVPFDPSGQRPPTRTGRDWLCIAAPGGVIHLHAVNTGSTHAVAWVPRLPEDDAFLFWSPRVEHDRLFPERTSLMWTMVEGASRLRVRIWERGVGETLGCGTGACAAAVLARATGKLEADQIAVTSAGGTLHVRWAGGESDPIFLSGPAERVFEGVYGGA